MTHTLREVQAPYTVDPADEAVGREAILIRRDGEPVAVVVPMAGEAVAETPITARDGRLVAAILPAGEYRAYREWKSSRTPAPATNDEQFEREKAAFQRLLPELLEKYAGQWVAIVNEQVTDVGPDFSTVIQRTRARFGKRPVVVQQVLKEPRIYRLPSPRIVRE